MTRLMACAAAWLIPSLGFSFPQSAPKDVLVEKSEPMKGGQGLGTKAYEPTPRERPFLPKVTEKKIAFWSDVKIPKPDNMTEEEWAKFLKKGEKEKEGMIAEGNYQLVDQVGVYVGWFGILREKTVDAKTGKTTLVLEHKYFDDMTDLHLQIVSLYGAGDFTTVLPKRDVAIPHLALVRVYGKVAKDEKGAPKVTPEYVRTWDWGLFSFMDYGKDKSNPKWMDLRKELKQNVYSSRPTTAYYEERLGKREPATK